MVYAVIKTFIKRWTPAARLQRLRHKREITKYVGKRPVIPLLVETIVIDNFDNVLSGVIGIDYKPNLRTTIRGTKQI